MFTMANSLTLVVTADTDMDVTAATSMLTDVVVYS